MGKLSTFQDEVLRKSTQLVQTINEEQPSSPELSIKTQDVKKQNISVLGRVGRLRIQPQTEDVIDVSLSDNTITERMYPAMEKLFGRKHDRYHHPENKQPGWLTENWELVERAVRHYANLR